MPGGRWMHRKCPNCLPAWPAYQEAALVFAVCVRQFSRTIMAAGLPWDQIQFGGGTIVDKQQFFGDVVLP